MKVYEWQRGEHSISTDRSRLQPSVIHGYLAILSKGTLRIG